MSPLWHGRFSEEPSAALWDFTVDLGVDSQLWRYDVAVNRAHARMLGAQGILPPSAVAQIEAGLEQVEEEFAESRFEWAPGDEDVHMAIERRLTELVGDAGASVHAARSRNDQVATDFRLWCRDTAADLARAVAALVYTLCDLAEAHREVLAPGYTHLQRAQPTMLGHLLLAHASALARDAARFDDARNRNSECPLGAGALTTTTLAIDPDLTAAELGFGSSFGNSIDAVAARDHALELLAAGCMCAGHLSRLAEEIVLWCSEEFGFLGLDDAWATGSSMMPQKKNPDVAELARAVPGRVLGAFVSLQTIVKGLPLAYNRDLQEDKGATFAALGRLQLALGAVQGLLATATFDVARLEAAAGGGGAAATDLAEALVAAGVPFRQAHGLVGDLVGRLAAAGRQLESVTPEELAAVHPALEGCAGEWLAPRACVERRRLPGGPHPEAVTAAAASIRDRLGATLPERP